MYSKMTYFMIWFLVAVVLVASGIVTFVNSANVEPTDQRDDRPLAGCPLVGVWDQQGSAGQYRVNVTPSVLYITSHDEADICEIEVLEHDTLQDSGVLQGVIRLHRVDYDNLLLVEREVKINYELYGEVIQLWWDQELELFPRLEQHQLIAMPGTSEYSGNLAL